MTEAFLTEFLDVLAEARRRVHNRVTNKEHRCQPDKRPRRDTRTLTVPERRLSRVRCVSYGFGRGGAVVRAR